MYIYDQPLVWSKHVKWFRHRRLSALTSGPKWWSVSGYLRQKEVFIPKPGNPVIVLEETKKSSSGCVLYYVCKKHLPRKIVPLRVPFLGSAYYDYTCRGVWSVIRKNCLAVVEVVAIRQQSVVLVPANYFLKNASFRLHPSEVHVRITRL